MRQRTIVTPESWEDVLYENKLLLNDFIEYCKSVDMSNGTISGYYNDIEICFVWNLQHNNNKFFIDFAKRDIMRYQGWLVNTLKNSPNRVRRMKAAISSMSNYVENILDHEYPNFRNIVNRIPAPAIQEVREKTILTDEIVDKLLDYLVKNKKYQQACAVALAISSGVRKSELLRFKVDYFIDDNIIYGSLYKTPEKILTKGRGKGKLLHKYVLVHKFKPYFDLWMQERERLGIIGSELFYSKRKGKWHPIKISTLNSWAGTFTKILGVNWYWHCNRNFFVTMLCRANIPPEVIKDIIGWENIDMISVYNDASIDDELGKYFGNGGIKKVENKTLDMI